MREANSKEIKIFKEKYCEKKDTRIKMGEKYTVGEVLFQELLPGSAVRSYAKGNRLIKNSFMMIEMRDDNQGVCYHPIFSESVGRTMLNAWSVTVPKKESIFLEENSKKSSRKPGDSGYKGNHINKNNEQLRYLILYARFMMIFHIERPRPLDRKFKEIKENLESDPTCDVKIEDVNQVNNAIKKFLNHRINKDNENFQNLKEFIEKLEKDRGKRRLKSYNFDSLREILQTGKTKVQIYF